MTREVQRQWRCDGDEVGSAWCNGKARCGSKAIVDGGNQIHYSSSPSSILVFSPLFLIVSSDTVCLWKLNSVSDNM